MRYPDYDDDAKLNYEGHHKLCFHFVMLYLKLRSHLTFVNARGWMPRCVYVISAARWELL